MNSLWRRRFSKLAKFALPRRAAPGKGHAKKPAHTGFWSDILQFAKAHPAALRQGIERWVKKRRNAENQGANVRATSVADLHAMIRRFWAGFWDNTHIAMQSARGIVEVARRCGVPPHWESGGTPLPRKQKSGGTPLPRKHSRSAAANSAWKRSKCETFCPW